MGTSKTDTSAGFTLDIKYLPFCILLQNSADRRLARQQELVAAVDAARQEARVRTEREVEQRFMRYTSLSQLPFGPGELTAEELLAAQQGADGRRFSTVSARPLLSAASSVVSLAPSGFSAPRPPQRGSSIVPVVPPKSPNMNRGILKPASTSGESSAMTTFTTVATPMTSTPLHVAAASVLSTPTRRVRYAKGSKGGDESESDTSGSSGIGTTRQSDDQPG